MEVAKNNKVDVSLWYSSSDDRALDFVKNMAEYIEPIIKTVDFKPKFVTWACPFCDSAYKKENCVSGGKYCAMQTSQNNDMPGAEVIKEDLRQHCIYIQNKDKHFTHDFSAAVKQRGRTIYFEYVARAHQVCRSRITTKCSQTVMEGMGIDHKIVD